MNSLSWLIYLASIVEGISAFFVFIAICGSFVLGVTSIGLGKNFFSKKILFFSFLFLIGLLIPNQKTLYMIAASEYGETAIKSETGQALLNTLREKLVETEEE